MTSKDFGPGLSGHMTIDPTTRTSVNIDYDEHRLNQACHFFVADYLTVPVGGTLLFTIDTTPEPVPRLRFNLFSRNILHLDIYEGVSNISGGTVLVAVNNHRSSPNVSDVFIKVNPTATPLTKLAGFLYDESGGAILSKNALILKPSTSYAIKIVPMADPPLVVNADVGYYFRWCE